MVEREKQNREEGEGEGRVEIERRFLWKHGRRLSYLLRKQDSFQPVSDRDKDF